jgi:hypothetical protein
MSSREYEPIQENWLGRRAPIQMTSSSPTSPSNREQSDPVVEFIPAPGDQAEFRRQLLVDSESEEAE